MERMKEFLDSSSIHGLSHISSTRKITRLFWILIVFGGFSGAFYLINLALSGWAENPVSTTIETLPIDQVTFPKVTVCPPKNTYTNLNYDVMMNDENMDDVTKKVLKDIDFDFLHDYYYEKLLDEIDMLQETNRYHNWYYGISQVQIPYYDPLSNSKLKPLKYDISTYAMTGKISTKGFGESLVKQNIIRILDYNVKIYFPRTRNNKYTMVVKLNKTSMNAIDSDDFYESYDFAENLFIDPDTDITNITAENCKMNELYCSSNDGRFKFIVMALARSVTEEFINDALTLKTMPGFELEWKILEELAADDDIDKFETDITTKALQRSL